MKIPILLKVLQSSATKANPNYKNTASRKSDGGFTLLEVLVTVLVLGILSSIAAPSWLAFINRQRVRTVNDRVLQTLRTAQSEAKRTKSPVTILFNNDKSIPPADPPTVTLSGVAFPTGGSTQQLNGGGEVKPRQITLTTKIAPPTTPNPVPTTTPPPNTITFDYQGNLTPGATPFVVTVAPAGGGTNQCVIVETLLGGMRTAEGKYDTNTKEGCPAVP